MTSTPAFVLLSTLLPQIEKLGINILISLVILILGRKLIRLILKAIDDYASKASNDATLHTFLRSAAEGILYLLLVFLIAVQLGFNTASIVTLLGSAALAIGLSLQGSLTNMAGGVVILFTRPFVNGDYIISGLGEGTVKEIGIIYTKIETLDKKIITVPNGALSSSAITNCSTSKLRRVDITVSVSYQADLQKAKEVILGVYNNNPDIIHDDTTAIHVDKLNTSSVDLAVCGFVDGSKYWPTKWQMTEDIKLALDAAGIEIPYTQMDVHVKNS